MQLPPIRHAGLWRGAGFLVFVLPLLGGLVFFGVAALMSLDNSQEFGVMSIGHALGSVLSVFVGVRANQVVPRREVSSALEGLEAELNHSVAEGSISPAQARTQLASERATRLHQRTNENRFLGIPMEYISAVLLVPTLISIYLGLTGAIS